MNQTLKELKEEIVPILQKNGVTKAGIFGSYARGEEKSNSDVDILIELEKGKDLFDVVGLKYELEKKIKRKVDLVEYCTIHPKLKDQILQEEVRVLDQGYLPQII